MHKKRSYLFIMALLLLGSYLIATLYSFYSLKKIISEQQSDLTMSISSQVYEQISSTLNDPITAGLTISNDFFLQDLLEGDNFVSAETDETDLINYLNNITDDFDFSTAFVISDKNGSYYSDKGFHKTIRPGEDPHDDWYTRFKELDRKYDFAVDIDEIHNNAWTVFVNCRIENENHQFLGVCGVGVDMSSLQEKLREYELRNSIEINLVDHDGVIQVDTEEFNLGTALSDGKAGLCKECSDYVLTQTDRHSFVVTRYIPALDWYLVVIKENTAETAFSDTITRMIAVYAFISVFLFVLFFVVLRIYRDRLEKDASIDSLTGLLNRKAFLTKADEILKANRSSPAAFLFLDLDYFKNVNDQLGHAEGDKLLKDTAASIRKVFRQDDLIARFGGDEFLVFLKNMPEHILYMRLEELLNELRKDVGEGENRVHITSSIGAVFCSSTEGLTSQELMELADKKLYEAKNSGRNRYCIELKKSI